jgi:hypothetical protein
LTLNDLALPAFFDGQKDVPGRAGCGAFCGVEALSQPVRRAKSVVFARVVAFGVGACRWGTDFAPTNNLELEPLP